MDYHAGKEPMIKAMHNAGLNLNDVVRTKHLPGMLELLRQEQSVSISKEVEAEINLAIQAYKRA